MTTLTVKNMNGVDAEFKKNEVKGLWENTAGRGGYLDTQLGIFRLSKLAKDAIEFLAELGVVSGKGIVRAIADAGIAGTTFAHSVTTMPMLAKQVDDTHKAMTLENMAKTAKNVGDSVASWMYVGIAFAGKLALLTPAKLVTFGADVAEGYTEWKEWNRISAANTQQANAQATQAISHANQLRSSQALNAQYADSIPAPIDVTTEGPKMVAGLKQLQTYQMLKMAKVVVSVAAGALFAMQFVPMLVGTAAWGTITAVVSAYVPGAVAALWTTQTLNMINATLSLAGSVFAVSSWYYKQSMEYQVEVKPVV